MDKLQEIVDMLHCYIQDGDMLVDFCCGSNDFCCLTKNKVDEVGKKCSYKNYDILQAKNDFCFETRDWMKVKPHELPKGSQLIMGLNPPFGVNAALANKFIDHALEFNPKLLILIVPLETQRLDEKKYPYDLIWADDQMFAGKSFYLPGSVDVNEKQIEDWNVNAPVLYLWSHPDWTRKHKAIAQQHGHPGSRKKCKSEEESHLTMPRPNQSQNKNNLNNKSQIQNQVEDKEPQVKKEEENLVKEKPSMEIPRQHQEEGSRDTKGDNNNRVQSNNHSESNMKGLSGGEGKKERKRGLDKKALQGESPTKRPAPIPSPNVSSSGAYSSKHIE